MRSTRAYDTFEEFEREELRVNRSTVWSLDELVEDFVIEDLELDLLEAEREEEDPADDDDDD
jgi:hypothetical protein